MKALYQEFFRIPKTGHIPEKNLLIRLTISLLFMILCLTANGITAYAFFNHTITSGMNTIQSAGYDLKVEITDATPAINYMAEMISEASLMTTSGDVSEDTSETTSEDTSKNTSENISENTSKNTSENTSEDLSQETLENMLGVSLESVLEDTLAKTLQVDEITPYDMVSGKVYQITLKYPEGSEIAMASTGFCVVEIVLNPGTTNEQKTVYHTLQIGEYLTDENKTDQRNEFTFLFYAVDNTKFSVRLVPHWGTSSHYDQAGSIDLIGMNERVVVDENGVITKSNDLQWLVDVAQEQSEPKTENVSTSANESTSDDESTLTSESVTESETTTENETTSQGETTTESVTTTEDETTTANETTSQAETTAESKPTTESESTTENETTSQGNTTTESKPTTENETTSQAATTTESETTSEAETTTANETTSQADTTTENEPAEISLEESTEESSEESVDESEESGEAA